MTDREHWMEVRDEVERWVPEHGPERADLMIDAACKRAAAWKEDAMAFRALRKGLREILADNLDGVGALLNAVSNAIDDAETGEEKADARVAWLEQKLGEALTLLNKIHDADVEAMRGLEAMSLDGEIDRSLVDEVGRWLDAERDGGES